MTNSRGPENVQSLLAVKVLAQPCSPLVPERRIRPDRRKRPTTFLDAFTSPGRRRGFRRAGEEGGRYVDRPSGRVVAWALAVVIISAIDAFLTLLHVRSGGGELTPTMRLALLHGENTFMVSKMGVTAIGAMILAFHQNFAIARFGFRFVLGIYAFLMAYHIFLVALR